MKDPKKMKDWQSVVRLAQRLILLNLIAFCAVMVFLIMSRLTEPTPATPPPIKEAPTFMDKADKYDKQP